MRIRHFACHRWEAGAMCLIFLGLLLSQSHAQLGPPPNILVQPLDKIVTNGGTATFTVKISANATPISYQWEFHSQNDSDEENLPGAAGTVLSPLNSSTLTFSRSNVDVGDVGGYDVRLRN